MQSASVLGRIAAIGVVLAAIVVVAFLLFSRGGGYTVTADFINAGQLVEGNLVQTGDSPVGSVKKIDITPDGQARVTLEISDSQAPLREGTRAVIRQASLSGIANRYVDLELPPGDDTNTEEIPNGGTIGIEQTTTAVDLDQVFNLLDPVARVAVQDFFKNSAVQFEGKEAQQRRVYRYLNPALSTSSRLFGELNRDNPLLQRFLTDSAKTVTALAQKRDDLSALIGNLNQTFTALGNEREALAESFQRLPGFMRRANTTFVNLRATVDDVDPLVEASRPVARKLQPFLRQLRPLANDARPTVRDLSRIVFQPGKDNDLNDLQLTFPPLTSMALDTKRRSVDHGGGRQDVGVVRGAFPETIDALRDSTPLFAFTRPYTPELMGWFDDFSTTGSYDASGGFSRALNVINAFSNTGSLVPLSDRLADFTRTAKTRQFRRCPGAAEEAAPDGSNVLSPEEQGKLECDDAHRATGPIQP